MTIDFLQLTEQTKLNLFFVYCIVIFVLFWVYVVIKTKDKE